LPRDKIEDRFAAVLRLWREVFGEA
jgi:hypothetical protein